MDLDIIQNNFYEFSKLIMLYYNGESSGQETAEDLPV